MKKLSLLLLLAIISLNITSCAYTHVRQPLDTSLEQTQLGDKVGRSSNYGLFWLFAWGDASYAKAAENGGIKTMHHSDQEVEQYVMGLYCKITTIVYGE